MIEIFVTQTGEELSQSEAIQQLLSRVTKLETQVAELDDENDLLLTRVHYLENQL